MRGRELDARSDLFSFGAVLYEMATGDSPFHGESSAVICEAIMNRAPVPAVRLNHDLPAKLEDIINKALEKDVDLRYQHASEMRSDLQRLKRDTDSSRRQMSGESVGAGASGASASSGQRRAMAESSAAAAAAPKSSSGIIAKVALTVAAVAVVALFFFFWQSRRQAAPAANSGGGIKTLAVLPLQNMGGDKDLDFLRLALADEIATSLSYVPSLTIRPFATTSKYDSPTVDLQEAGHAMRVTDVVTGHFLKEGTQLQITLEAIDIADNRTVWRDTMTVAAPDLIAMRTEITAKVRQGLVPALARERARTALRARRTKRLTIYICAASRCRTIRSRIKKPSPCWNALSAWTPATRPPGDIWVFATTTTEPIRTVARRCSGGLTRRWNGRSHSIRT